MKAILICPGERPEVSALAESGPLVNLEMLGNPLIHYWLEYFAACKIKEVRVLAVDRPSEVRRVVGDGSRWGLQAEVLAVQEELSVNDAQAKLHETDPVNWFVGNASVFTADHFPGFETEKLFHDYATFASSLQQWLLHRQGKTLIGTREIKPGIWVGRHSRIEDSARLIAPCWIGENVLVKAGAQVGPGAIVEYGVIVEENGSISQSWVGGHTFVGALTEMQNSFALGNVLINTASASVARIPDRFLLCGLQDRRVDLHCGWFGGRLAAATCLLITAPFALITVFKAWASGQRALRPRRAATPAFALNASSVSYFEFANASGWWKRWPQLLNVARGEFAWVGNRPLTSIEAGQLANEFERMWLAAPIGLISQGEAEGCFDLFSDEAKAHASFYSAQANWKTDARTLARAFLRLIRGSWAAPATPENSSLKERPLPVAAR